MAEQEQTNQKQSSWKHFFPVQLFFVHIKNNKLLLLLWLIILGFVTQSISKKYGVPYLYLTPEYMGEVNFISYFILGFSFGGFIMAFNISSYIINGHRFPFLATLSRPFLKYFINNFIWALVLLLIYIIFAIKFLNQEGNQSGYDIFLYMLGFLLGFFLIVVITFLYFINTNKDFTKLFGKKPDEFFEEKKQKRPYTGFLHKKVRWNNFFNPEKEWHVKTYLSSFIKIGAARNISHYDQNMLRQVFHQNHVNAALFEVLIFLTLIFLSFASDIVYFMIPAGASLNLMFTMLLMLTSAIHSWFRGWSSLVIIVLLVSFNMLSQFALFNPPNKAYGLDYTGEKAAYNYQSLNQNNNPINYKNDYEHTLGILERWKKKNTSYENGLLKKPKMVLITATGGGMRSALWAFSAVQKLDSLMEGELLKKTQLITGSSGGLIGLSYFRELYLQKQKGKVSDIYSNYYRNNMSKDILNRIGFSWTVNDMIFKFRSFNDGEYTYKKDRGYAFEQQLSINTDHVLDKRLYEYYRPELESKIPMLVISPTIVNDGRRLLISPQPISYLSYLQPQANVQNNYAYESVEFKRLFKNQDANNLKFLSALRMSSTFPYIMPMVCLPSEPVMEIMDAGLRDNYGIQTTLKFMYTFRKWIAANTDGVVIVQIRDKHKKMETKDNGINTIFSAISSPLGSVYKNLFNMQDYEHDQLIQYASEWFDSDLHVIDLILNQDEKNTLSLSWHLTQQEKKQVLSSFKMPSNIKAFNEIIQLVE